MLIVSYINAAMKDYCGKSELKNDLSQDRNAVFKPSVIAVEKGQIPANGDFRPPIAGCSGTSIAVHSQNSAACSVFPRLKPLPSTIRRNIIDDDDLIVTAFTVVD
jgi:hypothetical protein